MTTEENAGPTPPQLPPALPPPASAPTVGYCRACGKGLTADTVRYTAGTLYCAEHAPAGSTSTDNPYTAATAPAAAASPALGSWGDNPALAFILGLLIPGVGAVYNGQYAKGLVHAVVFGLLIKMADSDGTFGFLIPIFALYMAFEAMHTTRRRVAGLPVDEFSGLSDGGSAAPIGPIVLIGLGVLFLLINFDLVNFRYLVRWWPLGLIALGAYMLYDRVSKGVDRG